MRAAEEPLDVRWRISSPFAELEVSNPLHRTRYRVFLTQYPEREGALCTCTDFARRGLGTCKHLEAAWSWVAAHPPEATTGEPPPGLGPLWSRLERESARLARRGPQEIRDVEAVGRPLCEPLRS